MHESLALATFVRDEIDAGEKELDGTASVPRVTQHAFELVGGLNIVASQMGTINSAYLLPLKTFNTVVSAIVDVRYLSFTLDQSDRHCHRFILTFRWRWEY